MLVYSSKNSESLLTGTFFLIVFEVILMIALEEPILPASQVIIASVFSPMCQIAIICKMALVQQRFGKILAFTSFTDEVFPGVSALTVFIVAVLCAALHALLIFYFWPVFIDPNPALKAHWYYLCSPGYWVRRRALNQQPQRQPRLGVLDEEKGTEPMLNNFSEGESLSIDLQAAEKALIAAGKLERPATSNIRPNGKKVVISGLSSQQSGNKSVVDDLSLTLFEGEIVALMGAPNTHTSSHILNSLAGLS